MQNEEHHDLDEQERAEKEQRMLEERLQALGSGMQAKIQTAVSLRGEIEQRWLRDMRQYQGEYDGDLLKKMKEAGTSQQFANITRNKTSAAEARLSDMLFPTDDRNWGIKPTPVPELKKISLQGDEQQKQDARAALQDASDRSEAMQREIEDQLVESNYAAIGRDVIHDACVFGTGVMKGPVIVGRTKRSWQVDPETGVCEMCYAEDIRPGTQYVDIWNFYPEHGAPTVGECEEFLERHYVTKKTLRELAQVDGYLPDQIRNVLKQEPSVSQTTYNWTNELRNISGLGDVAFRNCYEMWEYNGPIDYQDLVAAGVELEEEEDVLNAYYGTLLVVGNTVIRAWIHPMETQDVLYRTFNWEKDRSSIFGFGVPYLMRNPQAVINATLRMLLDNGGLSAGPQIVVDEDLIEPMDKDWQLAPRKLWKKKKSMTTTKVEDAFQVYQISNNQTELLNIFNMARQLADEETNLPLIAQGEQASHVTKTAHGMEMLMNSANIVLRRAVKNFDDDVTRPHITAYYNWNMQFNDKPEIKGDFSIDARGSGALLAREMQSERLMMFLNVAGANAEFNKRTDWDGLYKQFVKAMQISADDVMLSDEEVEEKEQREAEAGPPIDPLEKMKLDLLAQNQQFEQQLKVQQLQQDGQLKMAEIASRENISIAQLQERTGLELQKDKTKRDIAAIQANHQQAETLMKQQNLKAGYDTY